MADVVESALTSARSFLDELIAAVSDADYAYEEKDDNDAFLRLGKKLAGWEYDGTFASYCDDLDAALRARLSQAGAGGGVLNRERLFEEALVGHFGTSATTTYTAREAGRQAAIVVRDLFAALAPSPSAEKVVNREAADAGRAAYVARYGTTPDTEPLWDDLPSDVKAIWRRVGMAARSTPPATPVQPTASVEAVDLHDFITHRTAWRNALIICEGSAQAKGDEDNRSYWSHEIGAFDRAFTIIEPLARASLAPAPTQGGGR